MRRRELLAGMMSGMALSGVEIQPLSYDSDGMKIRGFALSPGEPGKYPCVIYNRGGNGRFGALNRRSLEQTVGWLAAAGYVVVASQYRGSMGSEGKDEFGGADIADVLNLIPVLEKHPMADARRIGMFGWSRGGMMTYQALARTDRVRAAVVGGGSSDQFLEVKARPDFERDVYARMIPNYWANRERELRARSAVMWAEKLSKSTPILLLHGSADWRVPPENALRMAEALYRVKHPFRFVFLEGGDHGLSEYQADVNRMVLDWMNRYVRDGRKWPSLEPHGQ